MLAALCLCLTRGLLPSAQPHGHTLRPQNQTAAYATNVQQSTTVRMGMLVLLFPPRFETVAHIASCRRMHGVPRSVASSTRMLFLGTSQFPWGRLSAMQVLY